MRYLHASGLTVVLCLASSLPALGATYHVAPPPAGDDGHTGLDGAPWATLQHAADQVAAGDTVEVADGTYKGFALETSGTDGAPITFHAEGGAVVNEDNDSTPDGINLEGASYVTIDGFQVRGATRAGIRAVLGNHVVIQRNVTDQNGRWGIFTGFEDDLAIIANECSRSAVEHGIYVSNSGDRPVIRGNRVHDNNANGIHMNGDVSEGGDGIISGAFVEQNRIWGNGVAGGSGINCDGVQDSTIWNNLLYDNHASGISLYMIDGGDGAKRNRVVNNTVIVAADGRFALNIQSGSTDNVVRNNILFNRNGSRGSIDISADSFPVTSDYNLVKDRFSNDETFVSLADWRTATGQDAHSLIATEAEVFGNPGSDDYRLLEAGPAVNAGIDTSAPTFDFLGHARPVGAGYDIGGYEFVPGAGGTPGSGGAPDTDGGTSTGGADAAGGAGGGSGGSPSAAGGAATGSSGGASTGGKSAGSGGRTATGGAASGAGSASAGGASLDGGTTGGGDSGDDGGCGCRTPRGAGDTNGGRALALVAALGVLASRRTRRASRARR